MRLTTERLIIRPLTLEDTSQVFEYRSDKITNKFQSWIPENILEVEKFIRRIPAEINIRGTWFQFAIQLKETMDVIGDIGIHFYDNENRQAELGITISKHFQRRGLAKEALLKIVSYLFDELNKHRIIASVDPANIASIQLLTRTGFRKEGHFTESIWINGRWADDMIFALLKKEWL